MSLASEGRSETTARRAARPGLSVRRIGRVAGAEITGIDLSEPFDDATRDAILDALVEHHVIFFPNQDLSKEAQLRFTERFGEPEDHVARTFSGEKFGLVHIVSNLGPDGKPTKAPRSTGNFFWHTDKSYHAVPSLTTILHAKQLPPEGGSTQFANMYLGYEALPEEMKARLQGLRAIHSWEASRNNTFNRPATEEQKRERPPVSHPVVRTHPVTGRKLLYIGAHISHIEGMPVADGRALLYQLLDFATQPRFVYTHRWALGQVVMWDNRCLLHRAAADFEMDKHPRLLHRTVVKGTVPV